MPVEYAQSNDSLVRLTVEIVAAHVGNNTVPVREISVLISEVYSSLARLEAPVGEHDQSLKPAVPVTSSVGKDFIICLEDGKRLRTLKRYLSTHYGLTPEQYKARWNLPEDYPMIAPSYSQRRRELAMASGLGRGGAKV